MDCTGHSHDHDLTDDEGVNLREYIDVPHAYCLNESRSGAGRSVLKSYEDRLTTEPSLQCNYDEDERPELLFHIPFTEAVAIKSISIKFPDESSSSSAPKTVKIFANRTNLDFETARDVKADMKLELVPASHFVDGTLDYPLRPAGRFQGSSSITLYFGNNYAYDEDEEICTAPTEINYIGFKGKGTRVKRVAVEAVYETRGMKKDHQVPGDEQGIGRFIG
mmetsp:Transcript_3763/g.3538  ORF Transcript_3763/g.3538 Transcript_3763/m.3538 type:complete len:221 (-) Transcript_3763:207-869(-)|eukprot:CAMPEP_0197837670 /NCGR_PEP_ID=MMETSP1437-20131217/32843_1 /TAXON_ID=49252 ORGANISM="Eucampia antarctica, Strain CCMP1452" /NCGR_SAMPLE_ID=MMETSP1437 /ASSEMBLY_ACC=CAM_ASM_001096 /LENGTH=220 /DNA_ID=CAMNT_0043444879 /DNA_START=101 /DNA_END=763 /DNA_ORIENTATION=+